MRYSVLLVLLLSACAAPLKMSAGGSAVKVVNSSVASSCKHLGPTQGWQPVAVGGLSAAHVDVRNKVAARGGNAMVISAQYMEGPGHGTVLADAYRCP